MAILAVILVATLTPAVVFAAEPLGSTDRLVAVGDTSVEAPAGEFSVPFGSGSFVKIMYEGPGVLDKPGDELSKPMISVGFGWFIYVYLSRSDWQLMVRLGVGAATLWLAGKLALTGFGPYGAMAAGVIVSRYVFRWTAPSSGYCREIKFPYGTAWPVGLKDVRRSC